MSYILSAFADEGASELTEQIRICGSLGIKHIEMRGVDGMNISAVTPDQAKEIKKKLDDAGFAVFSAGSPFGKINIKDDFAPHLENFKKTVEVCHIIGAKLMRMFSFYMPEGEDWAQYKSEVCDRVGKLLDNAGGVTLCHENEKGIFGETPENCKILYDSFGGKLKLVFDMGNLIHSGLDADGVKAAYNLLKDGVEYFHIKDSRKGGVIVPAGKGDAQIGWILSEFAKTGKKVHLSAEPHLKAFVGYASLQSDDRPLKGEFSYDTAEESFSAAVNALKDVLTAESFKEQAVCGGYNEWIK
jgi:sugar phosphate isomerase/epimerase